MNRILSATALLAVAGIAVAQTPSLTINLGDQETASGAFPGFAVTDIDTSTIPSGFVAFRATADWSVQDMDPFSSEASAFFDDAVTFELLSDFVGAINAQPDGNPVNGLLFAGAITTELTSRPLVSFNFGSGGFGNANFNNGVLELFTADDLPSTVLDPGALSPNAPTNAIDLGVVGAPGDAISANTIPSTIDTELGLYTADGQLLASNDDIDFGILQSQVDFNGGLTVGPNGELSFESLGAGTYFLAVGSFNTTYGEDFDVTSDGDGGDFFGDVNGVPFEGSLASGGIQYYSFTLVPAPGAAALLGLAGVAGLRRRRA